MAEMRIFVYCHITFFNLKFWILTHKWNVILTVQLIIHVLQQYQLPFWQKFSLSFYLTNSTGSSWSKVIVFRYNNKILPQYWTTDFYAKWCSFCLKVIMNSLQSDFNFILLKSWILLKILVHVYIQNYP